MHNHISQLSIHREAVPDTIHTKNPFKKQLLHLNQSFYQPNQHHPAIPANKVHRHRTSPVSPYTFPFHHRDHHVIHRKAKALTAMLIVLAVVIFQFHMAVVHRLDTYPKIRHHLWVVAMESIQDSVEDIPVQVNSEIFCVFVKLIKYSLQGRLDSGYSGRLGSNGAGLFGSQTSSDLSQYMTQSERLAREQAQNVQGSGTYSGSALVDANSHDVNLSGSGSGSGGLSGSGGFSKVKSWENSSKWASGTQVKWN